MAEKECLRCIHHPVCKTAESCDGYVSGCEHFKEGWISVKDRLPEPGDYVLVCDIREDWYGLWEFSGAAWYDASYQPWAIDEVTHWQYLPQPPKGE